jgi:drug/metabolite transporter (DMT)-like permease
MGTDNLRAIAFMVGSMAAFAIEDFFIKLASVELSVAQILIVLSVGGSAIFAALCRQQRVLLFTRGVLHPLVMARNVAEVLATLCFVTSLSLLPISLVSSILQATPLLVTAGAALWLREQVGWRRWGAVIVGLVGVLIILRPGLEGFRPAALLAVLAVCGLAIRDLASRRVPRSIESVQLAFWAYVSLIPAALLLSLTGEDFGAASGAAWGALAVAVFVGVVAYGCLVIATRIGEVSVVIPFRYSRLIFALLIGIVLLHERPDGATLIGAAVVVASGLYALLRERKLRRPGDKNQRKKDTQDE